MTEHESRDAQVRVNSVDLRYLKNARDDIDPSLALGAVARMGAKKLLAEDEPEVQL